MWHFDKTIAKLVTGSFVAAAFWACNPTDQKAADESENALEYLEETPEAYLEQAIMPGQKKQPASLQRADVRSKKDKAFNPAAVKADDYHGQVKALKTKFPAIYKKFKKDPNKYLLAASPLKGAPNVYSAESVAQFTTILDGVTAKNFDEKLAKVIVHLEGGGEHYLDSEGLATGFGGILFKKPGSDPKREALIMRYAPKGATYKDIQSGRKKLNTGTGPHMLTDIVNAEFKPMIDNAINAQVKKHPEKCDPHVMDKKHLLMLYGVVHQTPAVLKNPKAKQAIAGMIDKTADWKQKNQAMVAFLEVYSEERLLCLNKEKSQAKKGHADRAVLNMRGEKNKQAIIGNVDHEQRLEDMADQIRARQRDGVDLFVLMGRFPKDKNLVDLMRQPDLWKEKGKAVIVMPHVGVAYIQEGLTFARHQAIGVSYKNGENGFKTVRDDTKIVDVSGSMKQDRKKQFSANMVAQSDAKPPAAPRLKR